MNLKKFYSLGNHFLIIYKFCINLNSVSLVSASLGSNSLCQVNQSQSFPLILLVTQRKHFSCFLQSPVFPLMAAWRTNHAYNVKWTQTKREKSNIYQAPVPGIMLILVKIARIDPLVLGEMSFTLLPQDLGLPYHIVIVGFLISHLTRM